MSSSNKKIINLFPETGYAKIDNISPNSVLTLCMSDNKTIIFASAPITGLSIEERVDASITKALDGNFIISSFGDSPVKITLAGVNVLNSICAAPVYAKEQGTVAHVYNFFKQNKVSADVKKRVKLSILTAAGTTKPSQTYTCALIGYDTSFREDLNEYGISTYNLHLIGVAIK